MKQKINDGSNDELKNKPISITNKQLTLNQIYIFLIIIKYSIISIWMVVVMRVKVNSKSDNDLQKNNK